MIFQNVLKSFKKLNGTFRNSKALSSWKGYIMKEIEYYKSNEVLENKHYQVPQELFINSLYRDKLNSDSKILYAFLIDRLSLSQKNHWIDSNNNVYLIFTRQEVQEKLNLSEKTAIKAFKQLSRVNLIAEKRQGLGKPNLIYVGKIQHEEITEQENLQDLNCKNYSSRNVNNQVLKLENLQTINTNYIKPNIIKTDSINPKIDDEFELKEIKTQCNLNEFTQDERLILEDVIDSLYSKDTLKVGNITVNHFKILEKLRLIKKENLMQLLEILQHTENIQNVTNYLIICLYNNLGNTQIKTLPSIFASNTTTCNSKISWNDLYDNGYYDTAIESS